MSGMKRTTEKNLMVFSGRAHPGLSEEVAEQLGTGLVPTSAYEFANSEIYGRTKKFLTEVTAGVNPDDRDLDASRDFFTRVLGLHVSAEDDNHVYLRAWQDWDHHTLVLTRAATSGLEHVAWRLDGPDALSEFEAAGYAAGAWSTRLVIAESLIVSNRDLDHAQGLLADTLRYYREQGSNLAIAETEHLLARLAERRGDLASALAHLKQAISASEAAEADARARRLTYLQVEFDTRMKEQQIALLEAEKELAALQVTATRRWQWLLAAGLVALLATALLLMVLLRRSFRERRRYRLPGPAPIGRPEDARFGPRTGSGRHILLTSPSLLTNHITGKTQITYRDLTPLAIIGTEYVAFTVQADSPIKTGADLVARLKKDPSSVSFGMATALGNHNHIAISQLGRAAGIDPKKLRVVVFNSSGLVVTNLLGGHVDVIASPAASVAAHAQSGKVRVIAISSKERLSGPLAKIPTWTEQGFPVVSGNVRNIVGPNGMKDEQVRYWDGVFAAFTQLDEWKKEADKRMLDNVHLTSAQTRSAMDALYKELREILGQLGLAK